MEEIDKYFLITGITPEEIVFSVYPNRYVRFKDIFIAGEKSKNKQLEQELQYFRDKERSDEQRTREIINSLYSEEEVRGLLIRFHNEFPDRWDVEEWSKQNKKK